MSATSNWERSAQICFIISVIVACDIVSFCAKFQSDSVNNGRDSDGWICTRFLPVKYSHVVVVSLFIAACVLLYWPRDSLPWVLITYQIRVYKFMWYEPEKYSITAVENCIVIPEIEKVIDNHTLKGWSNFVSSHVFTDPVMCVSYDTVYALNLWGQNSNCFLVAIAVIYVPLCVGGSKAPQVLHIAYCANHDQCIIMLLQIVRPLSHQVSSQWYKIPKLTNQMIWTELSSHVPNALLALPTINFVLVYLNAF